MSRSLLRGTFAFLAASLFTAQAMSQVCSSPLTATERGQVKFHPGHYISVSQGDFNMKAALQEAATMPQIKGIQRRYFWSNLQTGPATFNWKAIDDDIKLVAAQNLKLSIVIMWKFKAVGGISPVPKYIDALTAAPHEFALGGDGTGTFADGWLAAFNNPVVSSEFVKFMQKLSSVYDNSNVVSSIVFPETAFGVRKPAYEAAYKRTLTDADVTAIENSMIDGLIKTHQQISCAVKHTPVIQLTNMPFRKLPALTDNYKKWGIGMGGPDVWYNDSGLERANTNLAMRAYDFYPLVEQDIPVGVIIAGGNYLYENHYPETIKDPAVRAKYTFLATKGWSAERVVDELGAKALNQLKANYVFWRRENATDPNYLALKKHLANIGTGRESLSEPQSDCPRIYASRCVSALK